MKKAWIVFVCRRFSRVDAKGKSLATSILSVLGIAFGVMTLIIVLSVMNGFQRTYIDSILELSSFHVQISSQVEKAGEKSIGTLSASTLSDYLSSNKTVRFFMDYIEGQSLVTSDRGRESVALIRCVDPTVYEKDPSFKKELNLVNGKWDLEKGNIVIGSLMARDLGVRVGSVINFFALSGNEDVELLSQDRLFTVSGIYKSGYSEINSTMVFIGLESGFEIFGDNAEVKTGVKLKGENDDGKFISDFKTAFPSAHADSWREYNKSFFGALRVEKNILTLLLLLIFLVVGINIFNGMRRLVYERRTEISLMSALGALPGDITGIFVTRGFITGFLGSLIGLILGLLVSYNSSLVFSFISRAAYYVNLAVTAVFNHDALSYVSENPVYALYANIPARVFPGETALVALFGLVSPVIASYLAGKNVLKMTVSEVLRAE